MINKPFSTSKTEVFRNNEKIISATQKDCKPPIYLCNVKRKQRHLEVWVSGRNQHTANVPSLQAPKVRILLLPLS